MGSRAVILDTNVFVAAGFNRRCASASILEQIRVERLSLIWDEATRRETEYVVGKIPPLSWNEFADVFREGNCHRAPTNPERFVLVPDPDDRKFAALAAATGAVLLTNDGHLLDYRDRLDITILSPGEYWARHASSTTFEAATRNPPPDKT